MSLPVDVYVALQCWGGSECGSRSYAGNVSLCSARTGLEKPTTLFKEMAVRGPSAALFASSFLSFPLVNATFFSLYNYFPLCKKGLYAYLLGRSSTHLHTHTHTDKCMYQPLTGGVVWVIVSGTFVTLIGMQLCKVL